MNDEITSSDMITRYSLIFSYFFTAWNTRADSWAVTLFLSILYPSSLLPISIYFFSTSLAVFILCPVIAAFFNQKHRLKTAISLILVQKLCIINSAALLFLKSTRPFPPEGHVLELDWIFIGLVINGSILQLANMNSKIVIEKDWVVCLNKQHQDMNLEFLNSRLRFVDLFSDMIAPLLISGLAERFLVKLQSFLWQLLALLQYLLKLGF